jgi:hypothetical protein
MMLAAQRSLFTGAFNPLSLSPALWLSDTGSNPAQWDDLSGNGRHATQATAANQPAIVTGALNGRQVRRFDGVDDFLRYPDFYQANVTVMAVYQPAAIGTQQHVIRKGLGVANTLEYALRASTQTQATFVASTSATGVVANSAKASGGNWIIHTGVFDGANARSGVNGGSFTNTALSGSLNNGALLGRIGASYALDSDASLPVALLQGDIAEILVFPTALSTENRRRIEGYLSSKYNIAIS